MPARHSTTPRVPPAPSAMQIFAMAFSRSLVIQGLVTMMLVTSVVYLYITRLDVPDGLLTLTGAVMGFWFRSKQAAA